MKKILVACEYSQVVMSAFRRAGASAWSCDLEPATGDFPEYHFQCDVRQLLHQHWDLVIAHPPCTYLCRISGQWLKRDPSRIDAMRSAREFFMLFYELECPVCIENPYPLRAAELPPWSQVVCPSDFGHNYTKHTCLWLKGLPPLLPTHAHNPFAESWLLHCAGTGKRRARFWEGIADAMASQWLSIL